MVSPFTLVRRNHWLRGFPLTKTGQRWRDGGPLTSMFELAFRVLVEAAHPDVADAVTVQGVLLPPVCQEELYNPGRNVSINPN